MLGPVQQSKTRRCDERREQDGWIKVHQSHFSSLCVVFCVYYFMLLFYELPFYEFVLLLMFFFGFSLQVLWELGSYLVNWAFMKRPALQD